VIADGVTGVTIHGLSLVNGIAAETADASGGCMFVGNDAGLKLVNVTLRNCSAPGACERGPRGRGYKPSTLNPKP
jgi:hypothetical protein